MNIVVQAPKNFKLDDIPKEIVTNQIFFVNNQKYIIDEINNMNLQICENENTIEANIYYRIRNID